MKRFLRNIAIVIVAIVSVATILEIGVQATEKSTQYKLVWSDEFTGNQLNLDNWKYDIGGSGWGNNEAEYYTDREENVKVSNGRLVITARADNYQYDANSSKTAKYTSGRINSSGLQSFKYGKVEAKIKIPSELGLWPAFWMLGQNEPKGWPYCGEIDILETWNTYDFAQGALHWEDEILKPNRDTYIVGKTYNINKSQWHIYGIVWTPKKIQWTVDDKVYKEIDITSPSMTELHEDFYIILNCAIGGNLPHYVPEETFVSAEMEVDYVRVYQRESDNGFASGIWAEQDKKAINKYTVRLKNQGKIISTQIVNDGENIKLPTVKRKGYTFSGWYSGSSKMTDDIRIRKNITITAKWKKIKVSNVKITSKKQKYKREATLRFKATKKVDGYQVKVGNKKKITTRKVITFGSFKSKKTYKAKVRAYIIDSRGKKIYGKWSKTVKITIK